MSETDSKVQIEKIRLRLAALKQEQAALEAELGALQRAQSKPKASGVAANQSSIGALNASEKVALFRCLFSGRTDVFPLRWENKRTQRAGYAPACTNEWVKGVCGKPQVKCGECPNQAFIPVTDQVIEHHLRGDDGMGRRNGDYVAGVYPLFPDETCWFLAADFDGESWVEDALAYVETCRAKDVPAALERSRSGNGGHVWIFFSAPVPARLARQLGALLITETMERRPEIGFASYDRFFPSQDTMPIGGFGNLIALPLQRGARAQGNSVFVDSDLRPHEDQWNFLSSLGRLSPEAVKALVADAEAGGRVLGVRLPVEDENTDEPWRMPPSRRRDPPPVTEPVPKTIELVLADQIYIDRTKLPPSLVTRLIRLAAFQNPEFYRAQAMRLSTFGKPRIISCAELHPRHVALPRGCLDETAEMLNALGVTAAILDHRETGKPLPVQFAGYLRSEQAQALDALAKQDCGVLAATTAFGKTVVAAALIAQRACNTLILVHRRELLAQWVERLRTFLSVGKDDIGIIGGGCRKQTGRIDVALIQSLVRKGEVSDLIAGYGHLIVDECHHLSAASFELVARRSKARFVTGLSATVARKDGHHPIIFMQCGPVRHRVSARSQAMQRGFAHRAELRMTTFRLAPSQDVGRLSMPAVYAALAQDEDRNAIIFDDVLTALEAKRSPLVLTERRDHLELLCARFTKFVRHLVVLRGGQTPAERREADRILQISEGEERLVLATGRYLGEGYDDPRLDTLFLTMPISWRGTLAQYVGRLHRDYHGKHEVIVYDYVDSQVPLLKRMAAKRQAGYRALGYSVRDKTSLL